MVPRPVWRTDAACQQESDFRDPRGWFRDRGKRGFLEWKRDERCSATWGLCGGAGEGNRRRDELDKLVHGCTGRVLDCKHGVHCGSLLDEARDSFEIRDKAAVLLSDHEGRRTWRNLQCGAPAGGASCGVIRAATG